MVSPLRTEATMSTFDIRFMKAVCDDTGHEHIVCQSRLTVQASNEEAALKQAETTFCRQHKILDWRLHADAIELRDTN